MVVSRSPPALLSSAAALMNRMAGSPRLAMATRWKGIVLLSRRCSAPALHPGSGHRLGQRRAPVGLDAPGQLDGAIAAHLDQDRSGLVDDVAAEAGLAEVHHRYHATPGRGEG